MRRTGNYQDLMTFTEALVRDAAMKAVGTLQLTYQGREVDLSQPFARLTIREAIFQYTEAGAHVDDAEWLISALKKLGMSEAKNKALTRSLAGLQVLYFEETVEDKAVAAHLHHGASHQKSAAGARQRRPPWK